MTSKKVILITGANTGIGYATIQALLSSPTAYHVILGSRSLEKGQAAATSLATEFPESASSVEVLELDVTRDEAIDKALRSIEATHGRLDALVNNAGASLDRLYGNPNVSPRGLCNETFNLNVSSQHALTHALVPLLLKSTDARLIFITSGLSNLHSASQSLMPFPKVEVPPGWPLTFVPSPVAYRSSKAALNMVMLYWHWVLLNNRVKTWCVSPGFLATNLGGDAEMLKKLGAGDPSKGGRLIRAVLEGERDADVGKVVNETGTQDW